ncbi:MAG TPA: penicillin-binding protein 2 [Gemmatimonadales bacterium]|jgi:penicillin-binding protein 2
MSPFASWQVARRAVAAQWLLVAVFGVLVSAFFKAQVVEHERYRTESAQTHLRQIPLAAPRGAILDRNGLVIADNFPGYSIELLANTEDSLRAALVRLDALVPDDTIDVETVVRRWKEARYQPALVYSSGRDDVVARLEEHRAELSGLVIQRIPRRHYPDSNAVAHLVGYVGEVSPTDLENNTFPGAQPGEIVGKQGLEVEYDSLLRGHRGVRFVEVTPGGQPVREQVEAGSIPPVGGNTIRTTIDLDLQRFVDSMWRTDLTGKRGAMVAMTPDGQVLAYYSMPSYNPNDFIGRIDPTVWNGLQQDPNRPLYNRVIQAAYPPGSPFKLAMAALALRRGFTMESKMRDPCTGGYRFGNRIYHCWYPKGHGYLTLRQAIAASCDVYFYQLGQLLGADSILAGAYDLGFGQRSDIDIGGEAKPFLRKAVKDYVTSHGATLWGNGETLNLSIGQGAHTETLINMVSFYAALASDGIKRAPRILASRPVKVVRDLHIPPKDLQDLRLAMVDVVNGGTASADLAGIAGLKEFHIAGKTGSAQVTGQKDMGWFIAFAPAEAPTIVIGIAVEEGIHGALVAKYPVRAIIHYFTGRTVKADVTNVTEDLTRTVGADSSTPAPPPTVPHPAPKTMSHPKPPGR